MTADKHKPVEGMGNRHILVADDEPEVVQLVASNLRQAGFLVSSAESGPEALNKARAELPALIVLDIMLPGFSGLEVCKALRANENTARIPIVMLTAKVEEVDRIVGFELGADDYITKPFSPREMVLRIKSILRRGEMREEPGSQLKVGEITLDRVRHAAFVNNCKVPLTNLEIKLLATLMERRGRVQSRETLLRDVWGFEGTMDTHLVDTHLSRLRHKLGKACVCIETVRGFGYLIAGGQ